MSIPKIIHYCWFGNGKKSKLAENCIKSWKKKLHGYQIIEWNENNFDIHNHPYVKQAYENKKYAFVTDYVRLYALYNYGGIYFDTDVEVIKSIDQFLNLDGFTGFESDNYPITATLASTKNNKVIKELLEYYDNKNFINDNGDLDLTTNTVSITQIFLDKYKISLNGKMQTLEGTNFKIFPKDYFCAKDPTTKQLNVSKNTFTIHHFNASWLSNSDKIKHKMAVFLKNIIK